MSAALIGTAIKAVAPILIDQLLPSILAGRKGQVEKGMRDRLTAGYKATAGGRDSESATAQSHRNLQSQQQLGQALAPMIAQVARGAAGSTGESGVQALANLATNRATLDHSRQLQSGNRDAALKKAAMNRAALGNLEAQTAGLEQTRRLTAAQMLAKAKEEEGKTALKGQREAQTLGKAASDVFKTFSSKGSA